jgi:hypothetical protein
MTQSQRTVESPRVRLLIVIIVLRLSQLLPKFSFSRNNDYDNCIIFSQKNDDRLEPFFAKNKAKLLSLSTLLASIEESCVLIGVLLLLLLLQMSI